MNIADCLKAIKLHALWASGKSGGNRLRMAMGDMSGFDLSGSDLRNAYLPGSVFDYAVLDDCDFTGADLFASSFVEASARNCKFIKCDLRGASFKGANLSNSDLTAADLRGGSLYSSFYSCLGEERAKEKLKSLSQNPDANLDAPIGTNFSGASMERVIMKDVVVTYANFSGADMSNAQIVNTRIEHSDFSESNLSSTKFNNCNLAQNTASGGTLQEYLDQGGNPHLGADTRFIIASHRLWNKSKGNEGKRGTLQNMDLQNASFRDMDLSAFDFHGSNLAGSCFASASLRFCDFSDCDLSSVDFTGADLRGAVFRNTVLAGANLTNADLSPAEILDENGHKTGRVWQTLMMNCTLDKVIKTGANLTDIKYVSQAVKLASVVLLVLGSTHMFM